MHTRKRKKLVCFWGFMVSVLILYFVRNAYTYIAMEKLKASLKPGEFIVDLGDLVVENYLQIDEPDVNPLQVRRDENITNLYRQLPDTRPSVCLSSKESTVSLQASIIITYNNQERMTLLKTIYSILLRSPPELIQEILLVDDCSEDAASGEMLSRIPKVKIIRNQKQEGLLRSYNLAASMAQGSILTFLRAECEVNVGWLQPIVDRLSMFPTAVVAPVLDKIDIKGKYSASDSSGRGGFDWSLVFKWEYSYKKEQTNGKIMRSPVYPGHVFSILRERFLQLGKIDTGLEFEGGENFELSFKTWLCGGLVEILTCSRVGQYNLDSELHGVPAGKRNSYLKNIKRVAEVWMDDYKRFFYYTKPSARMLDVGSVMERKSLRKNLKCRNFKWYLDNVYTELRLPVTDEIMYGNIRQDDLCVDIEIGHVPAIAKLSDCNSDKGTQDWSFKKKGEISNGGMCLTADTVGTHGYVMIHFCTKEESQKWQYLNGQIYREGTSQCLDSHKADVGLVISQCEELFASQKWKIASKSQQSRNRDEV